MYFASLVLSLATATVALSMSTPVKRDSYRPTFWDLKGATLAPTSNYLTYKLVATVEDCKWECDETEGCKFVNTYHDVNGKNGSPLLTCAMYTCCQYASDATNYGGQTQPDGSVDYITDSDGWCKE